MYDKPRDKWAKARTPEELVQAVEADTRDRQRFDDRLRQMDSVRSHGGNGGQAR